MRMMKRSGPLRVEDYDEDEVDEDGNYDQRWQVCEIINQLN